MTTNTFVLRDPGGAMVAAAVTFDDLSGIATLNPLAPLASATTYTAAIIGGSAGIKGVAGNALVGNVAWSFTVADTTPPTLSLMSPANGATDVSAATFVTGTFSEPIDPATLTTNAFVLRGPGNAIVPATVWFDSSSNLATLRPFSALASAARYTATIVGGTAGIKDVVGNALVGNVVGPSHLAPSLTGSQEMKDAQQSHRSRSRRP